MSGKLTPDEVAELESRKQAEKQKAQARKEAQKLEEQKNASGNVNTGG